MTRSMWLPVAMSVAFGMAFERTGSAEDMNVRVGVKKVDGKCSTFKEDAENDRELKKTETLVLDIENRCGQKWNIRIDRDPLKSFSANCRGGFVFETDNLFTPSETRRVKCLVEAQHVKGKYSFLVDGSDPSQPLTQVAPTPTYVSEQADRKPKTSNLAIEVDP